MHLASYTALIMYLWVNKHIQKKKNIYVFDDILVFVSDSVFGLPKILEIGVEFGLHSDYGYQDKSGLYSFQFREFYWMFL